jgi:hypothetical protein
MEEIESLQDIESLESGLLDNSYMDWKLNVVSKLRRHA